MSRGFRAVSLTQVSLTIRSMADPTPAPGPPTPATEAAENEDDRRAAAAAVNRKRALEDWEASKKRWREMGVPEGLPAKK